MCVGGAGCTKFGFRAGAWVRMQRAMRAWVRVQLVGDVCTCCVSCMVDNAAIKHSPQYMHRRPRRSHARRRSSCSSNAPTGQRFWIARRRQMRPPETRKERRRARHHSTRVTAHPQPRTLPRGGQNENGHVGSCVPGRSTLHQGEAFPPHKLSTSIVIRPGTWGSG